MTTTLRVVLDQLVPPVGVLADPSRELARALVATAPDGCEVAAIVPAVGEEVRAGLVATLPGVAEVEKLLLPRRELSAAWQLGMSSGVGGGMIHSPTLMAPLVKHDRLHEHDQTVVTLWDLTPWEAPETLPRAHVAAQKALLKRAARHADAIVVPTHAHAERLGEIAKLGGRVRVIPGAAPEGFAVPVDEVGRRRSLGLPDSYVLLSALGGELDAAFAAVARAAGGEAVVVIDVPEGAEAAVAEQASAAGLPESHVHARGELDAGDRGAVLGGASVFVTASTRTRFPWRLVEALALGVPVCATDFAAHREVLLDGGVLAEPSGEALAAAVARVLGSGAARERFAVLAADRGRAFSWAGAAERVWLLHADL